MFSITSISYSSLLPCIQPLIQYVLGTPLDTWGYSSEPNHAYIFKALISE